MILIIFFYSKQSAQYKNRAIQVILLSQQKLRFLQYSEFHVRIGQPSVGNELTEKIQCRVIKIL